MAILKINGTDIKDPQTMQWDIADLDSEDGAGRNQKGELFRDRIAVKRQLTLTWPPLRSAEMAALLQAMEDTFFTLSYPDAYTGTRVEGTFYAGDRSAPMYRYDSENGWLWEGLSVTFMEK